VADEFGLWGRTDLTWRPPRRWSPFPQRRLPPTALAALVSMRSQNSPRTFADGQSKKIYDLRTRNQKRDSIGETDHDGPWDELHRRALLRSQLRKEGYLAAGILSVFPGR
jgi:hypothetical protein